MKVDRRVQYTKKVLKESLAELLAEKPIDKITVKEICHKADINRGTFYSHYTDQFDLYNNVVDEIICGIMERLGDFMKADDEQILANVTLCAEYIKENRELVIALLNQGVSYNTYNLLINKFKSAYYQHYVNETIDAENVNIAYTAYTASAIAAVKYWLESGSKKSCKEIAELSLISFNKGFESMLH